MGRTGFCSYFPASNKKEDVFTIKGLSLNEIESASFIPEYEIRLFFYAM